MPEMIEVFVSCAREDRELQDKLLLYLGPLKRQGIIALYDGVISAGIEWERVINANLESCQLIILLISPYFMNSDYCYCKQMQRAVERHNLGEARVIPVILRPTPLWSVAPFGKLQALPTNGKPVTSWRDKYDAFYNVTQGIQEAIEELLNGS